MLYGFFEVGVVVVDDYVVFVEVWVEVVEGCVYCVVCGDYELDLFVVVELVDEVGDVVCGFGICVGGCCDGFC